MTVIAYSSKHRVMAADSRCSAGSPAKHLTDYKKIYRLKSGALLGSAGNADSRDIRALLEHATPRKLPTRKQIEKLASDIEIVLVFPMGLIYYVNCEYSADEVMWAAQIFSVSNSIVAVGSGANFAIGAMEHGANPIQAVEVACRRDIMCFGPVRSERL